MPYHCATTNPACAVAALAKRDTAKCRRNTPSMPSRAELPLSSMPPPVASSRPHASTSRRSARFTPAQWHHRRPARGADRYQQGKRLSHPRPGHDACRRLRFLPPQAEKPGGKQGGVRAADRGFQGPRHRLFLLQNS